MVKLSATLPKEHDENGLFPNSRHLLETYTSGKYVPVVALVRTKEITSTEDYIKVPKVEIVHVEGAFDEADADEVRALLLRLHDDRVKHVKQPLDLPDTEERAVDLVEPRAIEAGDDVVDAEVIDEDTTDEEEN